jgi:DNA-binding NarL/FixJ family response regulator
VVPVAGETDVEGLITVMVVDDHRSFSELLAIAVDGHPRMASVGVATSVAEAVVMAEEIRPSVVVMDLRLPDGDGIEATARLREAVPSARVVLLTAHPDPGVVSRAAAAGAAGCLHKESRIGEILEALASTADHGMYLDAAVLAELSRGTAGEGDRRVPGRFDLTERERDVLDGLGQGLDPQRIAIELGISVHTSRGHVRSIFGKLGAHSQLEAVVIAAREGLLVPGAPQARHRRAGDRPAIGGPSTDPPD